MSDDDRDEDHLLREHMEKVMTLEIPAPVLEVIKDVVLWSRGSYRARQRVKFVAYLGISNRARLDRTQECCLCVGSAAPERGMTVDRSHEIDGAEPDV